MLSCPGGASAPKCSFEFRKNSGYSCRSVERRGPRSIRGTPLIMGKFSPHMRHRNHPLIISVEFCGLFDGESNTRVSSKSPLHGHTRSCRRVNFIESHRVIKKAWTRVTCWYPLGQDSDAIFRLGFGILRVWRWHLEVGIARATCH